ncbi:MAG: DmsE family decaheme c-type cytochrome [Candidatus Acidiferrales bacterium]
MAQEKSQASKQDAASNYVGPEVCKTCHEDIYKGWEKTPHWKTTLDTHGGPSEHGCEACHGPGSAHVEGGGDKSKIFTFKGVAAKEISSRCLTCHTSSHEQSGFSRSVHLQNNVSCIDCHSPHHPKESEHLMKEKQPQLCYGCHLETKQQFARPFHHRVNEGLVRCTDCHNPHGTNQAKMLRATSSQDLVCFKCHTDKQGPFVFEHQPVKVEGCVACHVPHGSSNPRLLKRSQVNVLCLECHSISLDTTGVGVEGPLPAGPAHNQNQKYQACTMCHTQIHGSNFSFVFFK